MSKHHTTNDGFTALNLGGARRGQARPGQARRVQAGPGQATPGQAKPGQAKVLTGGGDLSEPQVDVPPVC